MENKVKWKEQRKNKALFGSDNENCWKQKNENDTKNMFGNKFSKTLKIIISRKSYDITFNKCKHFNNWIDKKMNR